jgi:hypothetical protein
MQFLFLFFCGVTSLFFVAFACIIFQTIKALISNRKKQAAA